MNSIIQAGQFGLQQSYQRINQAAHNIASAPTVAESSPVTNGASLNTSEGGALAPSTSSKVPLESAEKSQVVQQSSSIEEGVLELRRQQQVFTASARVVSVGQEMVGTLLDDYS